MKLVLAVLAGVALTACSQSVNDRVEAERIVRGSLKDPSSAKFSEVRVYDRPTANPQILTKVACGYVNAKNGYGGYGGDQRFIVLLPEQYVLFDGDLSDFFKKKWTSDCRVSVD